MTESDKRLIEKAYNLHCRDYRKIDALIDKADTPDARRKLADIQWKLYELI
ncbi:MAG: hypothetical protein K2I48_09120 [Muribaculaceae bacterium]|nr:hypothetical protein [Muribaculaceae bacterium]